MDSASQLKIDNPIKVHSPTVTVSVQKAVIDRSIKEDSAHCMIAEAIRVCYPDAEYVSVDLQTIRFSDAKKRKRYTYLTPRSAQMAIVYFDMGIKPNPFSFNLRDGQITNMGKQPSKGRVSSEAQIEAARKNMAKARNNLAHLQNGQSSTTVPTRVGGKTPPVQKMKGKGSPEKYVPFSRRRQFGLRALDRAPQVDVIE